MFAWPTQILSCLNSCFSLPKYCLFFFSHLKATITRSPCFSFRSLIRPYSTTQALGHSLPVTHWQCEHVSLNSHLALSLLSDLSSIFHVLPWVSTGEIGEGNSWNMSLKFGWIIMLEDRERFFSLFSFSQPNAWEKILSLVTKSFYTFIRTLMSVTLVHWVMMTQFYYLRDPSLSWATAQEDCSIIACDWR